MTILKRFLFLLFCLIAVQGCKMNEVILFTNKDNSAILHLTHYTKVSPTLGPCGFGRPFDFYTIHLSNTQESYESTILGINCQTCDSSEKMYRGNLKFNHNRLYVKLYEIKNGKEHPLTINGKHKYEVVSNEIAK